MGKPRVLFLCTHNAARSQMAEALLRHHAGDRFGAYSAGLEPTEFNPLVAEVLSEVGVSAEGQRAKGLREFWTARHHFAYTITVCAEAEADCPQVFPFTTKRLYWPTATEGLSEGTPDERRAAFRRVRDALSQAIQGWLPGAADYPRAIRTF